MRLPRTVPEIAAALRARSPWDVAPATRLVAGAGVIRRSPCPLRRVLAGRALVCVHLPGSC